MNQSTELLVLSYIFPILEKPDNSYIYFESVAVPLAKELLDEIENQNNDIPNIEPILLLKEDSVK